jgi:hypothetical protein
LWNTLTLTNSLGWWISQYCAITSRSGPSARRGTGRMRMPSASSRANSTAQPGSSTITQSPARSRVRLTMSSACVAPTVVMICSGTACTLSALSFCDSARRRPLSPMGSPYCSENSRSAATLVTLRTAAGMKLVSSQSDGNTPMPGCGLLLTLWNMPRISAVASTGACRACIQPAVLQAPSGSRPAAASICAGLSAAFVLGGEQRRIERGIAHKKTAVLARHHQALRQQLVVGGHHGGDAHALLLGAQAHRGQARARRQQAAAYALGKARRELFGQRLGSGFHQHGGPRLIVQGVCAVNLTSTVWKFVPTTVLVVYCFQL